ncbi:MAG: RNA 2',3'-cyclic phosphodiesterase [Verrucomicrobia bacterium]|nr:MAG: RNA 2',3'-cyclic phosphodiesterase [Verrucomicrobiota bacterium]
MVQSDGAKYRLFISIHLPDEVKSAMEQLRSEISQALPRASIRWLPRDQLHLTLKFLGNTEAANVDPLTNALRTLSNNFSAIELTARGLGCFPDIRRPRVIWVGVQDHRSELELLHKAICTAIQPFTAPEPEEKFTGHATLGRIKQISRSEAKVLSKMIESHSQTLLGTWTAANVELMRSELSSQGAHHTCVASVPLKGSRAPGL